MFLKILAAFLALVAIAVPIGALYTHRGMNGEGVLVMTLCIVIGWVLVKKS